MASEVLVATGDGAAGALLGSVLAADGHRVRSAADLAEAERLLVEVRPDLLVLDPDLSPAGSTALLTAARAGDAGLEVVLLDRAGPLGGAAVAEADDRLRLPLAADQVRLVCRRAAARGRVRREVDRERRSLERQYRQRTRFLAGVSHELRTPLTTIIGMSEVLAEGILGPLNPKQARYVTTIEQSAKHLLGLINDILDFSKVEAGKMTLELGEVGAAEAVATACALVEGLAAQRGQRIDTGGDVGGGRLQVDRGKLVQILVNLLSNAVKFSPPGSTVSIRVSGDADRVRFAVADRGIGIASEELESIFEEFQQVRGGASGKDPGTGLGLALSRSLARLLGGELRVRSTVGEGSEFVLTLPRRVVAAPEPVEEAVGV